MSARSCCGEKRESSSAVSDPNFLRAPLFTDPHTRSSKSPFPPSPGSIPARLLISGFQVRVLRGAFMWSRPDAPNGSAPHRDLCSPRPPASSPVVRAPLAAPARTATPAPNRSRAGVAGSRVAPGVARACFSRTACARAPQGDLGGISVEPFSDADARRPPAPRPPAAPATPVPASPGRGSRPAGSPLYGCSHTTAR